MAIPLALCYKLLFLDLFNVVSSSNIDRDISNSQYEPVMHLCQGEYIKLDFFLTCKKWNDTYPVILTSDGLVNLIQFFNSSNYQKKIVYVMSKLKKVILGTFKSVTEGVFRYF